MSQLPDAQERRICHLSSLGFSSFLSSFEYSPLTTHDLHILSEEPYRVKKLVMEILAVFKSTPCFKIKNYSMYSEFMQLGVM